MKITSFVAPELDVYARLSEIQLKTIYEPDEGLFVAESPNVIERALAGGYEPVSFLIDEKEKKGHLLEILEKCGDVPVYEAEDGVLSKLIGLEMTRGVLCAMKRKKLPALTEVIQNCRRVVVLEEVMNPTNVGAIFRSAAALNVDAVLLTPGCSDPLYRRAARVSMGTVFQVPWTFTDIYTPATGKNEEFMHASVSDARKKASWPADGMRLLKENGFKTVSMALCDNSINLDAPELKACDKLAIIMGTESDGLKQETMDMSDFVVKIPMSHNVDSLNVAAAAAVVCWELCGKSDSRS